MPAAVWVSFRLPFESGRFIQRLGLHFVACAAIVAISQGVERYTMNRHAREWEHTSSTKNESDSKNNPARQFERGMLSFRAGLDVLLYWSVVGVCQAITSFRRSQLRERRAAELEARLTRSQLHALRMQINPHFLFNTLNAVSTLIYVNPRAADEMLTDLSELLRRSLDAVEEQETPLEREIQFIRAYIAIEQRRFGDRLQVKFDIQDGLANALVPSLVLQPLVENAIRHGIEPLRAPGLVTIQARRDGPALVLTIQDNGKGPPSDAAPNSKTGGVGLANTQGRLRGLYGPNHQFTFRPADSRGCFVEIRLPYHTAPAETSLHEAVPVP